MLSASYSLQLVHLCFSTLLGVSNALLIKSAHKIEPAFIFVTFLAISGFLIAVSSFSSSFYDVFVDDSYVIEKNVTATSCVFYSPRISLWILGSSLQSIMSVLFSAVTLLQVISPRFYITISPSFLRKRTFVFVGMLALLHTLFTMITVLDQTSRLVDSSCSIGEVIQNDSLFYYTVPIEIAASLGVILSSITVLICSIRYMNHKWSYSQSKACSSIMPLTTLSSLHSVLLVMSILVSEKLLPLISKNFENSSTQMLLTRILFVVPSSILQPIAAVLLVPSLRQSMAVSCPKRTVKEEPSIRKGSALGSKRGESSLDLWSSAGNQIGQMDQGSMEERADRERSISFYREVHIGGEDERLTRMREARERADKEKKERREKREKDKEIGESTV